VRPGIRRAAVLLAVLLMLPAGGVTLAAFTATSATSSSNIQAGSVKLTDNDSGGAVLSLSAAVPGATDSGCITVAYEGSLPSAVALYGATSGTGLDEYLDLTVTRGTWNGTAPAFDSCTNFQADPTNYVGAGAGVVYSGTLRDYPDAYAGAVADPPSGGAETWTNGESHVYRLQVTLQEQIGAQGKNATQTFIWEARSQ